MDRQAIIAIVIAVAVLLGWSFHYSSETQKYNAARLAAQQAAEEARAAAAPTPVPESAAPTATGGLPPMAGQAQTAAVEEKVERLRTPALDYVFTNLGGGIAQVTLSQHLAEHGAPVELNRFGGIPIGALSETPGEGTSAPYTLAASTSPSELTFARTDARQLQITKKFTLPQTGDPDPYRTQLTVTLLNQGAQPLSLPALYVYTGSAAPVHQRDLPTYTGFGWLRGGGFEFKDSNSFQTGWFLNHVDAPVFQEQKEDGVWAAVTNQYFSTIVTPREQKGVGAWAHRFAVDRTQIGFSDPATRPAHPPTGAVGPTLSAVEGALQMPGVTLAPGATATQNFTIYTGPREYRLLRELGAGQDEIMSFGMFKIVSKTLLNSMNWLHSKLGSYAAAIIVLTIIIRGLMWPLQNKATQSMKKMQALQPEMTKLKEKYQDDPARMNQELMKLYKVYQINPVAGCLPMVVQIPVFFGFYNMLGKAVELRNAPFLWVHDLSQPDTVAVIAGYPLNVLPLLMAVTMLGQMRLSPKSGDPVQQRVFMFMPLIFIFFCYNFASALALYWTVQNLFSIGQLYVTRNQATPALQKVALPGKKKGF